MRLIDADTLIKAIDGNPFTTDSVKSYIHVSVAKMPTIEPERKKGHWIEHEWAEEVEGLLVSNYECSCCHLWERKDSDFCPNCGSYNGGEEECMKVQ